MDMNKDLIILSAELSSTTFSGNRQRTENLKLILEELGLDFAEAVGYYKDKEETSFVVQITDQAEYDTVTDLAFKSFHQEAVLYQKDEEAYLVSQGLYTRLTENIGVLVQVNPKEVEGLDNFTIVNNRVYTTKK